MGQARLLAYIRQEERAVPPVALTWGGGGCGGGGVGGGRFSAETAPTNKNSRVEEKEVTWGSLLDQR